MKILAVGKNYLNHVKEFDNVIPEEPVIFTKPDTALLLNNAPFYYPDFSKDIHFETELVIKIDKEGKYIDQQFAKNYYSQIALGIDFTARDLQLKAKAAGLPWALSKGFNGAAPVSSFIDIKSLRNPDDIAFHLTVNNTERQKGTSSDMLFSFDHIIAYISQFILLKKGDLIFTGTPEGVGPVSIGDHLTGYIEDQKMLNFEIK